MPESRGELINTRARAGARWADAKDLVDHLPKKSLVRDLAEARLKEAWETYQKAQEAEDAWAASGTPKSGSTVRTVTQSEFRRDPGAVVQRAEQEGPIVITDEKGKPRMEIYCPREKLPVSND